MRTTTKTTTTMKKYITKAELKGYDFNNFWNNELFNDLNRKDENGYNGRYVSTWYFDGCRIKEVTDSIQEMIWVLIVNYFKSHAYDFHYGHMSQLRLSDVAEHIAEKFNTWSGEIVRWMKGMEFGKKYDLDICDRWGLDSITIFINK